MRERERESHASVTAKFIYDLQAPVTSLKFILTSFILISFIFKCFFLYFAIIFY